MTHDSQKSSQFDLWNKKKKEINNQKKIPFFREGQVWFISMGINIGFEENGKNEDFSRPVLILKAFSKNSFLGIPTTTIHKDGRFYFDLGEINGKNNYLILSQIRLFSSQRLLSHIGGISKTKLIEVKQKIKRLIE